MSDTERARLAPDFTPRFQRKTISFAPESLVRTERLPSGALVPIVIRPAHEDVDLVSWATTNREHVATLLLQERALLFRGFQVRNAAYFERFVQATSTGPLLEYKDRSTPRYEVGQRIYVSTIYPPEERIHPHNEGTYWATFPLKIYFCCMKAPATGGETPIADVRKVYQRIDPAIRDEFEKKQVMYVRTYNPGIGLTWQDAFQTNDPRVVEDYAQKNAIHVEWRRDGRLVTRQVRPAVRKHPVSGEPVWFNHAAFFHVSSLDPVVREALISSFGMAGLPYNTCYGDGSPIAPEVAAHLREAYAAEKLMFPWKEGDVMLLDNLSMAHAREPYTGERNVIVAMTEAQSGATA
jgi:alpha-ketoglutarate-dependent taurine dioxygenase